MVNASKIFYLLDKMDIDQKDFAVDIGLTPQVVSKWRTGLLKSYTKYWSEIANYFSLPIDYFLEQGVFKNWDKIRENLDPIYCELGDIIPSNYEEPDDERFLMAHINLLFFFKNDEIGLIQWFASSIKSVAFGDGNLYEAGCISIQLKESLRQKIETFNQYHGERPKMPRAITAQEMMQNFMERISQPLQPEPWYEEATRKMEALEFERLTNYFNSLNAEGQEKLLDYAADLHLSGRYKKHHQSEMGTEKDA